MTISPKVASSPLQEPALLRGKLEIAVVLLMLGLGLALSLTIIAVLNFQTNYRNQDWRGLVNYLVANQQSHDFILLANPFGYTQPVFDFYYIYNSDVPIKLERHFPGNEATPLPERVAGWFKEPERVWLVSWYDNNTALIEQELKPAIPVNFKLSYYQEYRATEAVQGTIALSLYVRT